MIRIYTFFMSATIAAVSGSCAKSEFKSGAGTGARKSACVPGTPGCPSGNGDSQRPLTPTDAENLKPTSCSAEYDISGKSSPYFAGVSDTNKQLEYKFSSGKKTDRGSVVLPVLVVPSDPACLVEGTKLSFSTSGSLSHGGGTALSNSPDGKDYTYSHMNGPQFGKSNLTAPADSIVGVFVGPDDPSTSSPPGSLDFSTPNSRNFTQLAPMLNQIFFIGDGKTSGGEVQLFVVPPGASRLYLAVWDVGEWSNNIGSMKGSIVHWSP